MVNGKKGNGLSRGEFLKVTALTLTALFVKACSKLGVNLPTETPESGTVEVIPSPTTLPGDEEMTKTQVAFVKTTDRTQGVQQAIDMLGINPAEGKHVFLKPNFNSADPAPGSTHPDVLRAIVTKLWEMGASKITLGDRSGMGNTRAVMEDIGVFSLANELGFEVIVFDEMSADEWEWMITPDSHWELGFPFAVPPLNTNLIVNVCCLKTHQFGGHFTMSLKNSVGMVAKTVPGQGHNYMTELHSSSSQREMIAEANLAYEPALIVLDGVDAFIRGGPARGDLAHPGVILAGTDRVAIDALGAVILKMNKCNLRKISQTFHLRNAIKLGIGVDSPEKIHIVTDGEESTRYAQKVHKRIIEQW